MSNVTCTTIDVKLQCYDQWFILKAHPITPAVFPLILSVANRLSGRRIAWQSRRMKFIRKQSAALSSEGTARQTGSTIHAPTRIAFPAYVP